MIPKYKDIVELIKKGSTLEAQEKIMELREAAIELQEENIELKSRIRELEQEIKLKNSIDYMAPAYWVNNGTKRDGPYCQRCYDAEQKLIRLQDWGEGTLSCMNCGKVYETQI